MRKISSKITLLTVSILIMFGAFWVAFQFFHQQIIQQYNMILERYLLLNRISVTSEQLLIHANQYFQSSSPDSKRAYEQTKNQLIEYRKHVGTLKNQDNLASISNYEHLLDSEMEVLDLALQAHETERFDDAFHFYNQATEIRRFISETTSVLYHHELTFHEQLYEEMIDLSHHLLKLGIEGLFIVFLVLMGFTYWFSKGITRSIRELIRGAKAIASGVYNRPIRVSSKDEIAFLADTFEKMRESVKQSFEALEAKAKLEKELKDYQYLFKEMELRILQNQIKPHFLFNTLNTLSKKAYLEGSYETSDLIATVAELLRYQLRKADAKVQLGEEIEMIRNYITILKARFTSRLQVNESIDERCLHVEMPSFILQPLVENAFIHGIESKEEGGTISYSVRDDQQFVLIEIADDGVGISPEIMASLLKNTDKGSKRIGLQNVIRRLELYYQCEDVMKIYSEEKKGTRVTLRIPKQLTIQEVAT